jgi:hypothetical protein
VGKPERKRPLERPRRRLMDNIKMHLTKIEWYVMDWIDLAKDRENGNELSISIKCLKVLE